MKRNAWERREGEEGGEEVKKGGRAGERWGREGEQ
jgi:hypothetical protein